MAVTSAKRVSFCFATLTPYLFLKANNFTFNEILLPVCEIILIETGRYPER